MNVFAYLEQVRLATLAARTRCADESIGTRVRYPNVQIVSVTYPAGKSAAHIEPLSEWISAKDAVSALEALPCAS